MLRFKSLTIYNFGPFKEKQTIDFTDEDGVTIIWGNNGCGKTTILNIIKFLFFGYYKNRMGKEVDLMKLPNIEGTQEGKWDFGAVLEMEIDGVTNELTRQCVLRKGINRPQKKDDFIKKVYIKRNGEMLSPDATDHILKSVMPEDVSRFFFFDGELLQEYEELLVQGEQTDAIKDGIERILGVPVLTNASIDAHAIQKEYDKVRIKAARDNTKTEGIAVQIEEQEATKAEHEKDIEDKKAELAELQNQQAVWQKQLDQNDYVNKLIADKEKAEENLKYKEGLRDEKLSQVKEYTKNMWKWVANPRIDAILEDIDSQLNELQRKEDAHAAQKQLINDMQTTAKNHHCEVCGQDVDDEHVQKIIARIGKYMTGLSGLTEEENEALNLLKTRKASLKSLREDSQLEVLVTLEAELTSLEIQIPEDEENINDLSNKIKQYGDEEELKENKNETAYELAACTIKIDNINEGIRGEKAKIEEIEAKISSLNNDLKKFTVDSETELAGKKADLCEKIYKIFDEGVDKYREKLKKDVERDATELFSQITNDTDYTSLRINDNYGLDIVHKSGDIVPLRSSGFEHVVALSLIGALHKNAPMQGPIVMDSPFGRLDPEHTDNIIKVLPDMADQILLLVYNEEINAQKAREILEDNDKLRNEYQLVKESSFHTEIINA